MLSEMLRVLRGNGHRLLVKLDNTISEVPQYHSCFQAKVLMKSVDDVSLGMGGAADTLFISARSGDEGLLSEQTKSIQTLASSLHDIAHDSVERYANMQQSASYLDLVSALSLLHVHSNTQTTYDPMKILCYTVYACRQLIHFIICEQEPQRVTMLHSESILMSSISGAQMLRK